MGTRDREISNGATVVILILLSTFAFYCLLALKIEKAKKLSLSPVHKLILTTLSRQRPGIPTT